MIHETFELAKKCIYIANYDFGPALRLLRKYGTGPRRPQARMLALSDSLDFRAGAREHYSLQDLLIRKAKNGVEVKVIVWEPRLALRILPGADERGIDGRADQVERINQIANRIQIEKNLSVLVDSTAPTLTSAHHEKIIVVDYEFGFIGGLDLSKGKWDTSKHEYDSTYRDVNSEPWHDVHAMVRGPIVWDLLSQFHQRWAYCDTKSVSVASSIKIRSNFRIRGRDGNTPAIALRTWRRFAGHGGIKAWYTGAFSRAKESIYIENQFPFQSDFLTRILAKRLREQKNLKVIIVSPMEPNLPGFVGKIIAKISVNDVNKNLAVLRGAGQGRVETYSLISQDKSFPEKRRQIYVHSKLAIVDDKWLTVGSANLDKNGLVDSSEFNVAITSVEDAIKCRIRLWQEHLQGGRGSII